MRMRNLEEVDNKEFVFGVAKIMYLVTLVLLLEFIDFVGDAFCSTLLD